MNWHSLQAGLKPAPMRESPTRVVGGGLYTRPQKVL